MIPKKSMKEFFFSWIYKNRPKNIMFFENDDESYTMVDLYLTNRFLGYKDSYIIIMILTSIKYYYSKKVIMNILLDITM